MKKFICFLLLFIGFTEFGGSAEATACCKQKVVVNSGLNIPAATLRTMTSKELSAGDTVEAQILEDLYIDGVKVFQKGDRAFLNVLATKRAGILGAEGQIFLVDGGAFDVSGYQHNTEFTYRILGKENHWSKLLVFTGVICFWPLILFVLIKGEEAVLLKTVPIDMELSKDFEFMQK